MGKKILFFLAWLGIFCIGIFNIVYLVLPSLITKYITISSFLLETAILALSVLYILLAVYKLMTKFERNKDYQDRKSTRLNSSHANISYAVFCLKKKKMSKVTTRSGT